MVEPVFRLEDMRVTHGFPMVHDLRSAGSGKMVHIHFCRNCGTKLYLTFERFADTCGIYAGTFDDPNWFAIGADNARHLYADVARHDTILPAGINVFSQHALRNDGAPCEPVTFDHPQVVGERD
jgi:hypothetical protein